MASLNKVMIIGRLGADPELRLHHGTLNAVILPTILRYNHDHVGDKYVRLRQAMKLPEGADIAVWIEEFNSELNLPANLSENELEQQIQQEEHIYVELPLLLPF